MEINNYDVFIIIVFTILSLVFLWTRRVDLLPYGALFYIFVILGCALLLDEDTYYKGKKHD